MARCSKKTLGGGGCQTCHDTQAKKPAAILIFEAKKKKQSEARAGRQGGKAKAEASKQPQHGTQPGETAAGKGRRKREGKTKGARQPGGTEKRDKRDKKKEQQSKKQRKAPPGEGPQTPGKPAHSPHQQTTRHPHPKRRHPREGPNETRCVSIRSHQPRGVRRARQDSNQTIKSCQDMCPKRTSAPLKESINRAGLI